MTNKMPIKRGRTTKKGAGKLGKTEVLQFRIDPMSRFAIELAARYQKRTLSSAFDVAVEAYINGFSVNARDGQIQSFTHDSVSTIPLMDIVSEVWDHDEALRFLKLAQFAPALLSSEERLIWNIIQKEQVFWQTSPTTNEPELYVEFIQALWPDLQGFDPDEGLQGIDFKPVLLRLTNTKKPEKLAALRKLLDELYVSDFDV